MDDNFRWLYEQAEMHQTERRGWHEQSMAAYEQRGAGISGLMTGWLVTRTVVELGILIALIWR